MPDTPPLLEVEGLRTWFPIRSGLFQRPSRWVRAVDGVDLLLRDGETLALVGESGCGKTTVGRSILRLEEPREGSVRVDGVDLLGLDAAALHPYRRSLQIIFQDSMASLDPRMRVVDAVCEGMRSFGIGDGDAWREKRAEFLLERVRLDVRLLWRYPHELSGGQRQRVCIARALALEPRMIVCDEAVSALDVSIQAQILNLLADLQREDGLAYLFITHDLGVVRHIADRVAVMYLGQIVETAPTEELFANPRHPYTQGLLAAVPSLDPKRRARGVPVLGDVPSPSSPPAGCRFHTRCSEVFARCSQEAPQLKGAGESQLRCFLQDAPPAGRSGGEGPPVSSAHGDEKAAGPAPQRS
ncbi:MAG: ABC transporter ATP-binding protein [Myxococcota bacterium]